MDFGFLLVGMIVGWVLGVLYVAIRIAMKIWKLAPDEHEWEKWFRELRAGALEHIPPFFR